MLVPDYLAIPVDAGADQIREAARSFPCVLKPLGLSGSRGVIRANDFAEFDTAFARIRKLLNDPEIRRFHDPQDRLILIEEFIPGREFALEGVMTRGALQRLAIFDKPDPLNGPFFEETLYVTPSREDAATQTAMSDATECAIAALGLYHGPIHAEMRVNERGVWMLEIAARPIGGLCAGALRFEDKAGGTPFSLEELLLKHAAGRDVTRIRREAQASGVLMMPVQKAGVYTGVVGVESALARPGIESCVITAKEGQVLLPLPEGSGYPGFLFARGLRTEDVERSLREAQDCLTLAVSPVLPIAR
jgi:biotin carboxylase